MDPNAASVISAARALGLTVATAESLTGGLVAGALTAVPGASDVFVGGVVAYNARIKASILGVGDGLLEESGPVSEEAALAMATGARVVFSADAAVATTGVAGPEAHGGEPPGTVCMAAVRDGRSILRTLHIQGDRDAVRREAVAEAIVALVTILQTDNAQGTTVE